MLGLNGASKTSLVDLLIEMVVEEERQSGCAEELEARTKHEMHLSGY